MIELRVIHLFHIIYLDLSRPLPEYWQGSWGRWLYESILCDKITWRELGRSNSGTKIGRFSRKGKMKMREIAEPDIIKLYGDQTKKNTIAEIRNVECLAISKKTYLYNYYYPFNIFQVSLVLSIKYRHFRNWTDFNTTSELFGYHSFLIEYTLKPGYTVALWWRFVCFPKLLNKPIIEPSSETE